MRRHAICEEPERAAAVRLACQGLQLLAARHAVLQSVGVVGGCGHSVAECLLAAGAGQVELGVGVEYHQPPLCDGDQPLPLNGTARKPLQVEDDDTAGLAGLQPPHERVPPRPLHLRVPRAASVVQMDLAEGQAASGKQGLAFLNLPAH